MKILQASYQDLAGIGYGLKQAIDLLGGHECRAIHVEETYIHYEDDIIAEPGPVWDEWIDWADIIHVHEYTFTYRQVRNSFPNKPIVWHIHGNFYREYKNEINGICEEQDIPIFASTVDLLEECPKAEWLPAPIGDLTAYRKPPAEFTLMQTRTNPNKGSLPKIPGVVCRTIENVSHDEALRAKGTASILFDQFELGLGVSGLEAMAMGIPVLSGGPEWVLIKMRKIWGQLPFLATTPEELPLHVKYLKDNPDLREFWSERGLKHIGTFHDPVEVAEKAVAVYKTVLKGIGSHEAVGSAHC